MAVIKPISFAAWGVVAVEKTYLCVSTLWHTGFFCEVSVLSVQHLLQLCGHAFGRVPMRVVGVPGERAQGAAPKSLRGGLKWWSTKHQVWKLNNLFLLVQPQGWQVCAASIGDKSLPRDTNWMALSHTLPLLVLAALHCWGQLGCRTLFVLPLF